MSVKQIVIITLSLMFSVTLVSQDNTNQNKFRQLYDELATPNSYRTASGAPGHEYWQQKADYNMDVVLDDLKQTVHGEATITYTNNSPDVLSYLWMQLDQNVRAQDSDSKKIATSSIEKKNVRLKRMLNDFDGGFKIEFVKDTDGNDLPYTINKTMMRVDLPKPIPAGGVYSYKIKWWYNINDRMKIGGRSGYEYFEDEDNYIYTIAQFFPRMAVYCDNEGWQHKQFLGNGEFTLNFGDYDVNLTVPADHIVASTGELQNTTEVLTSKEIERFEKAKTSSKPVMVVTEKEANAKKKHSTKTKTWNFKATNVRDFGWASSRKFMWDAIGVPMSDGRVVMAMSYYPKEGNPLWGQYSTAAVKQTLITYSKHTFDYPYPVAISVHTKWIGMEYPMICFNGGRPEDDGTYSESTKNGLISVVIHEVGHNYFPMIVNSDERQWTWMDEGLNTFCQYLTEQEFDRNYKSRRGEPRNIVNYMKGDKSHITPIMTNSESLFQFGANAYAKPATALNILRETVMGRELFDFAFKEYANRWKFKSPSPADFFRTMEDASAVDLDWFWRGWFYTTDHVDISLDDVKWFQINTQNPSIEKALQRKIKDSEPDKLNYENNLKSIPKTMLEENADLKDFYTSYDPYKVTDEDQKKYKKFMADLDEDEKRIIAMKENFYELSFSNIGGLVMPLIIEFTFTDGSKEIKRIPAEIWRKNNEEVTKVFLFKKEVVNVTLDPLLETADTELDNNFWPPRMLPTRFEIFKGGRHYGNEGDNPMQKAKKK